MLMHGSRKTSGSGILAEKKLSRYKRVLVASIDRLLAVGPKSPLLKNVLVVVVTRL